MLVPFPAGGSGLPRAPPRVRGHTQQCLAELASSQSLFSSPRGGGHQPAPGTVASVLGSGREDDGRSQVRLSQPPGGGSVDQHPGG